MKQVLTVLILVWLLKHFVLLPVIDWEEHEITGVEFRINFKL